MGKNNKPTKEKILSAISKTQAYVKSSFGEDKVESDKNLDDIDKNLVDSKNVDKDLSNENYSSTEKTVDKTNFNDISSDFDIPNDESVDNASKNISESKIENNNDISSNDKINGNDTKNLDADNLDSSKASQQSDGDHSKNKSTKNPKDKIIDINDVKISDSNFNSESSNSINDEPTQELVDDSSNLDNESIKDEEISMAPDKEGEEDVDISFFSHEKFVDFVKSKKNPLEKIRLMGKRISFLNSKNDQLRSNISEIKTRSIQLASDYENLKKDETKNSDNAIDKKISSIFLDIIPSIDIFEMALSSQVENEELKKWLVGFKMIYNQLFDILESNGVKKIEINRGDKPNHNYHNQIEIFKTDEIEPNLIWSVKQSGYMYKEKLLRVASVVVSGKVENDADSKKESKHEDNKSHHTSNKSNHPKTK